MTDERFDAAMEQALAEARAALAQGDVPVGAVLLDPAGRIVAAGHNLCRADSDPTAHAEIVVLRAAARAAGTERLDGHTLVTTLEPCAMCAMAAVWARVERIVYGAPDPKAGAAWSLYNIPQDARLNHRCDLIAGVHAGECAALLEDFFQERRS